MMTVTRGALALSIMAVLAGPLLSAAPAVGAAVPAAVLVAPVVAPQPAPPGPRIFVEVSPSTVEPGYLVGLEASCQDNSLPAIVVSDAFGRVQVRPQNGILTAAPMVRDRTRPGDYRVKLECRDGETASTMLQVVKKVPSSRGPATGFGGGSAGDVAGGLLLPGGVALTVAGLVVWAVSTRRSRGVAGR